MKAYRKLWSLNNSVTQIFDQNVAAPITHSENTPKFATSVA